MRNSESFKSADTNKAMVRRKKLKTSSFLLHGIGKNFMMIAFLILMFSLFACQDNSGIYRGKLSDNADALSKVYKDDLKALKSFVDKDDTDAYNNAIAAKNDLYLKFQTFATIKPSKRFAEKQTDIQKVVEPVLKSLDELQAAINSFKNGGKIDVLKNAYQSNFTKMNEAVDKLNKIFETMKENEVKKDKK